MLCDSDRWHDCYYFVCEWFSLSHSRWLEYSFHFDNSRDYSQQSQSSPRQDLYVKIPVSYQPKSVCVDRGECSWGLTHFCSKLFLMPAWSLLFDIFSALSCLLLLIVIISFFFWRHTTNCWYKLQHYGIRGLSNSLSVLWAPVCPITRANKRSTDTTSLHQLLRSGFLPLPIEVYPAIVSFRKQLL